MRAHARFMARGWGSRIVAVALARIHRRTRMGGVRTGEGG